MDDGSLSRREVGQGRGKDANDGTDLAGTPLPLRLQLDTVQRVRQELVRLYVEAKRGARDVGDASKLANMLALVARMIEGGEVEKQIEDMQRRLDALEQRRAAS